MFHSAGHEVYSVDSNYLQLCRFSNAVKKSYVTPAPSEDSEGFIKTLLSIIEEEKIDLLIPIWEEVLYISKELRRFPKSCRVFTSPFEIVRELHNKYLFIEKQKQFGFDAPETYLLRSSSDLEKLPFTNHYIAKASYCRGSQKLIKVEPGEKPDIDFKPNNLWIAQEWLEGKKYCTYSVCQAGKVLAHTVYPVSFTMEDRSSCLAFTSFEHKLINDWVTKFIRELNFTGQVAFDFIETSKGKLYAIECNPRATSGVHLFKPEDRIDRAFFNIAEETILSSPKNSKQIAIGMILYGWKVGYTDHQFLEYLKKTFSTSDVIFSLTDIKPFLCEPLIAFNYWLQSVKAHSSMPKIFTRDFDWNG